MWQNAIRNLAVTGLAVGLLAGSGLAAQADQRDFRDRRGDTNRVIDITRVHVGHFKRVNVAARHQGPPLTFRTVVYYYLDTKPRDAGPEYRAYAHPDSDVFGLERISGWRDHRSPDVRCRGLRMRASTFDRNRQVTMSAPRACLSRPAGVRVTVRAVARSGGVSHNEWAPAFRTFYPRVRHN